MVNFVIFYRDPKKCFSPLRVSQHDWQKIETNHDKSFKIQQDKISLLRREHGVAHEEESYKELKNSFIFCFK